MKSLLNKQKVIVVIKAYKRNTKYVIVNTSKKFIANK